MTCPRQTDRPGKCSALLRYSFNASSPSPRCAETHKVSQTHLYSSCKAKTSLSSAVSHLFITSSGLMFALLASTISCRKASDRDLVFVPTQRSPLYQYWRPAAELKRCGEAAVFRYSLYRLCRQKIPQYLRARARRLHFGIARTPCMRKDGHYHHAAYKASNAF